MPKLYSTTEAAKILGRSPARVRALAAAGELQGAMVGNQWTFTQRQLDAYSLPAKGRPKGSRNRAKVAPADPDAVR